MFGTYSAVPTTMCFVSMLEARGVYRHIAKKQNPISVAVHLVKVFAPAQLVSRTDT
jgi:hypothetical protein